MSTNRDQSLRVRVTGPEKEHVERAAAMSGLSVSDYVRSRIFGSTLGNGTAAIPGVASVGEHGTVPVRATSNAALYASSADVESIDARLSDVESAVAQAMLALKKPNR